MLVLFETPAGYALFKVLDESKLSKPDNIWQYFQSADAAQKIVALQKFSKFENITEAMSGATAVVESKLSKGLRKFLQKTIVEKEITDKLAVADAKLGGLIKNKLGINCVHDNAAINELMRGIRTQIESLIEGLSAQDMKSMALGLSHSLGRYKLKFSPDKVDIMIVQAISLLDDLDKELNTYAMRAREWYGWHFPELGKIIPENVLFAKTVQALGFRTNAATTDLTSVLPEEMAKEVKDAAQISMGTEVSEEDINNITDLCVQVISIAEYRDQLYDYLKNRMQAIAPNLTVLVGEIVGARLIAKAGNLMNLAKYPASTVQILGAEKALFRALKTKHETPKYGLIYHASLIGQAGAKNKGKISRLLAAKASLSARVDALGDKDTQQVGTENRAKVESRIRQLEGKALHGVSGQAKAKARAEKYDNKRSSAAPMQVRESAAYSTASDATLAVDGKKKKKKLSEGEGVEAPAKKSRKEKEAEPEPAAAEEEEAPKKEKKQKKEKKEKKEKKHKSKGDDE